MTEQSDSRIISLLKFFSKCAGISVGLVGGVVLIGWIFDIATLKSIHPNLISMKANTALAFLLISISLWLLPTEPGHSKSRKIAHLCAFTVASIGLLTLIEYLFRWNLGIDQLLFKEALGAVGTSHPGRMAPNTAFNFLIIGIALLLLDVETRLGHRPAQFLILIEGLITLFALIGYTYGVTAFYGFASYTKMAIHTAVLFLVVCAGILFLRPDRGLMMFVASNTTGGILLRRLLPTITFTLVGLGWLRLLGEQKGFYGTEFGIALFVTLDIVIFAVLIFATSKSLHRIDTERKRAEEVVLKLTEELEQRVIERTAQLETANQELRNEIAERERVADKMREQAALLDIATDAILVKDMEDRILFWNKGAEHVYGWRAEEAIGKKANELLYKEVTPELTEALKAVIEKDEWSGELHQITKDGKEVIVQSRWSLVRDSEGQPKSKFTISTDITAKKQLEAQFMRSQRMESIGTLASGIAHDLNNVLTPILMAVQMLRKKLTDNASQKLVDTLEASAQRGAGIIKQVLTFARGVKGERILLQPKHLIKEMEMIAKETFPKSIQILTNIPKDLWTVLGDPTQFQQVLMNLCVNARDAMPNGGKLEMIAENITLDEHYAQIHLDAKPGPYVALTVSDTGIGIPPAIMEKIFEPFFTTKENGKGTGLGLSTVLGIVKNHDGFINVYSEIGRGTKFKIYLPAVESIETRLAENEQVEIPLGNGETVLVVDDEASIREITRATLEKYGYKVMTASDGTGAVVSFAEHKGAIDIVLIDMVMPIMSGEVTIRALQKMDPQVKIIAVSGLPQNGEFARANGSGKIKFLQKPYTTSSLLTALGEVLYEYETCGITREL